ncbi:ketopantoate reductase family protein [Actinoallomurus rhizosphaericola]|uniref:ketopantoate reductase family protein n=1 Tax=Actinoallomurus rhizosphaericola TaxID=2952536 RepID=UPI002092E586|nr:2-dehydropantoate 2-reductase [Actinoallomurus rhizosphaericola]MCO5996420.1 2-dehydropantoate 2-reductase [Actinoallomurus rhizosphaericola]
MRFVVYGAGAVGGVIGARLFQHGHDVTLIARGAHYEALRDRGLRLDTPDESVTLPVPVADRPSKVTFRPDDVVLLAMKTQDTLPALAELAAVAPPDVAVACAQNGVENERLALRRFPRVYGVCVLLPSAFLEPGVVEAYAVAKTGGLDVGRYPGGVDGTAESLAAAFAGATFVSEARPDVMRYKYGKLLMNLGNAVEAVIGPGERGADIARLARDEGEACLRAAGIDVLGGGGLPFQTRPIRGRERGGGSSYQSLRRGTGTIEADYLNGEIVLLGREHGVPTPVNDLLRRLANRMAHEGLQPGLMTPEEFLAALDGPAPE